MGQFSSVLDDLKKFQGIRSLYLINAEGALLEALSDSPGLDDRMAEFALSSLKASQQFNSHLNKGGVEQNYVEYKGVNVTLDPLPLGYCLVVVALPRTNLGRIRYEIKRCKKLLEERLGTP